MPARIPYDSLTLRAVADELDRLLTGGVVQHIAQPAATDLILTVRSRGANHALLLSCDAAWARAHLTSTRRPNPPTAPPFCMLCRKHVEGARVAAIAQRGFDRVLDIALDGPSGTPFTLVVELMGRHSNLILVDSGGAVLDAAKRIPHRLSRLREVLPGRPYAAPPDPQGKVDPFAASPDEVRRFAESAPRDAEAREALLIAHFMGLSPFLSAELAGRWARLGTLTEVWEEVFGAAERGEWAPVVVRGQQGEPLGAYPLPTIQYAADQQHARDSMQTALDHFYSQAIPREAQGALRREVEAAVAGSIRARQRQAEQARRGLAEADRSDEYRRTGELLLANLHLVAEGAREVVVRDYYAADGTERTIDLDPDLTPQQNAEAWFRRYRKAREGGTALTARLEHLEAELGALEAGRLRLEDARTPDELHAVRNDLVARGLLRVPPGAASGPGAPERRPDFEGKKIRTVHTPEGWEVLVGENSEANDYLTGRVAAPNDLWFHVRANTSAHVVVRTRNQPAAVPPSVLQRAALLAAQHSAAKHSSLVPVDYTLRKHVRRPRRAASGTAVYQNEKTLYVNPADA